MKSIDSLIETLDRRTTIPSDDMDFSEIMLDYDNIIVLLRKYERITHTFEDGECEPFKSDDCFDDNRICYKCQLDRIRDIIEEDIL